MATIDTLKFSTGLIFLCKEESRYFFFQTTLIMRKSKIAKSANHLLVIWTCAPHVCGAVHQPREIQIQHISNNALRVKCPIESFAPAVHRNDRWQNEAQQQFQRNEISGEIKKENPPIKSLIYRILKFV